MSKEFTYLFHNACELLKAGGMTAANAESRLWDLLEEGNACFAAEEPAVTISDYEYDLSQEIIRLLTTGGVNYGHAILLTATFMAAVEDVVTRRLKQS